MAFHLLMARHQMNKNLMKALLVAGVIALVTQVQAIPIFSDNFNSENGGNGALNYNGFANWSVSGGTVDLIGAGTSFDYYPGHGLYVDLDGSTSQAGTMSLGTSLSVAAGNYVLSFELGGSTKPDYGTSDSVHVSVDTGFASQDYIVFAGESLTTRTIAFTVTSPTTLNLSFHNAGGDNVGAILDDVDLNRVVSEGGLTSDTVPEGGLTASLLGLGMLVLGGARRFLRRS